MKGNSSWIKRILYKNLSLNTYLSLLSKLYLISFRLGLLKGNKLYKYPYFLKNVVNKGDVCIDIGANLGYLTTLFSRLVGANGKVYAVEPVKPILAVLKNNTQTLKNVEILPYALGEENKPIQLGNNTVSQKGYMATGRQTVIDSATKTDVQFDAEMRKGSELFGKLEKLNFIKCDIEGYEAIVLQELEAVILKHRPMLLVESGGENRKKLLQFFKERDFNSFILNKNTLTPATPKESTDMLIVPIEKQAAIKAFIN